MSGTAYNGVYYSPQQLQAIAAQAANTYGVPQQLFLDQIAAENSWGDSTSSTGAVGVAQWLPSSAANPGFGIAPFNPQDPTASLNAAAQYDSALYQQTGSWSGALLAYVNGLGNVLNGSTAGQQPYQGNYMAAQIQADINSLSGSGGNNAVYNSGYGGSLYNSGGVPVNPNAVTGTTGNCSWWQMFTSAQCSQAGSIGPGGVGGAAAAEVADWTGWLGAHISSIVAIIVGLILLGGALLLFATDDIRNVAIPRVPL